MLLAAFDWNAFWQHISPVLIVLVPAFFGWLNLRGRQRKTNEKLDAQNVDYAEVKEETKQVKKEAQEVKEVLKKTHALVNGPHLLALKENVRLSKRLANITGAPEDIQAAKAAEIILENNAEFTASLEKD